MIDYLTNLVYTFALFFYFSLGTVCVIVLGMVGPLVLVPIGLAVITHTLFGVTAYSLLFHVASFGFFSTTWLSVVEFSISTVRELPLLRSSRFLAPFHTVVDAVDDLYHASFPRKVLIMIGLVAYCTMAVVSVIASKMFRSKLFFAVTLICVLSVSGWLTVTDMTAIITGSDSFNSAYNAFLLLLGWTHRSVMAYRSGRRFRRLAMATLLMWIVNVAYYAGLITARHRVKRNYYTRAKVLRSMSMAFARYVDGLRLPQIFRSAADAGFSHDEERQINENLDSYLDWLRSIGYPVAPEISEAEPIALAGGQFDANWLVTGSNWRIYAPQLQAFAQPEFRKFQHLVEEYRPSMGYANLDNQLMSISRYFSNPEVNFPEPKDVLDVVWDVVKDIYQHSEITSTSWIYKKWNKKFNVGVYATSAKRNPRGGLKKLSRREWIQRIGGPKAVVGVFDTFVKYALAFDTHAQFFTKVEWLKPSKWMNDVVRTPVAAMLPEYVVQMVLSADPNKRFYYERTPIKLGMPIKHSTFSAMWARHSRFKLHYAGDCHSFDSTIVGPVMRLIKAVRLKGFEAHKDYKQIEKILDRVYDAIEHGKMVSANSGNVYKKGTGLMTGHASTSPDNSLAMVSLYLVAWKQITGRSAEEFRAYNELSVYGDDHVLSISELAPPLWNWDNITRTMAEWGVDMYEEVDSKGKGLPLHEIPFLKKKCRIPTTRDVREMEECFGEGFNMPKLITVHDKKSLLGKAMAPMTNRNPLYRAKRIQSFMYLCAHDKESYDVLHFGIEQIFNRYPNIRADIGKYTPPYNKVLRVWFTEHVPIEVLDFDDESVLSQGTDSIVMYGEVTLLERAANALSLIPDIVNPALRNIGPIEYFMRTFGTLLSWPKAFMAWTNGTKSKGHLEALIGNSSYDWISKSVSFSNDSNKTSLLLRHWLYMMFQDRYSYSLAFYITGAFSKLISLNFIFNGFVAQSRPKFAISYWNVFLVLALNWLNVPTITALEELTLLVKMPDVIGFLDDLAASLMAFILHKIPTSFADVANAFPGFRQFVVKAPTGSGKSTDLVYLLSTLTNAERIFVIEPRVNLCIGLAQYLTNRYPWDVGSITGDGSFNEDARVIYITHGSFLQRHRNLLNRGYLFVVDEFHVPETLMTITNEVLLSADEKVIFTSATPIHIDRPLVELTVAATYSYEIFRETIPGVDVFGAYLSKVLEISRGYNPWYKHLVFVDSFNELDYMAAHLPGEVGSISSRGVFIGESCTWILATSTADVGVTIPNVDVVVTRTHRLAMGELGLGQYALPESLITQRAGRTGRTNNGFVHLITVATTVHVSQPKETVQAVIMTRLQNGMRIPDDQVKFAALFVKYDIFYDTMWAIEKAVTLKYGVGEFDDIALRYPRNAYFISTVLREVDMMLPEFEPEDHAGIWEVCRQKFSQVVFGFETGRRIAENLRCPLAVERGFEVDTVQYLLDPNWAELFVDRDWIYDEWYGNVNLSGTWQFWSFTACQHRRPVGWMPDAQR
jgi:hypothetical protein